MPSFQWYAGKLASLGEKKNWFVTFGNFCSINPPPMADSASKIPKCENQYDQASAHNHFPLSSCVQSPSLHSSLSCAVSIPLCHVSPTSSPRVSSLFSESQQHYHPVWRQWHKVIGRNRGFGVVFSFSHLRPWIRYLITQSLGSLIYKKKQKTCASHIMDMRTVQDNWYEKCQVKAFVFPRPSGSVNTPSVPQGIPQPPGLFLAMSIAHVSPITSGTLWLQGFVLFIFIPQILAQCLEHGRCLINIKGILSFLPISYLIMGRAGRERIGLQKKIGGKGLGPRRLVGMDVGHQHSRWARVGRLAWKADLLAYGLLSSPTGPAH